MISLAKMKNDTDTRKRPTQTNKAVIANGSSRGGGAFPVGTYATCKKATAFVLDWLLFARAAISASHPRNSSLTRCRASSVVDKIVAESAAFLTPAVLGDFVKAHEACQCTITLRESVSQFFSAPPGKTGNIRLAMEK